MIDLYLAGKLDEAGRVQIEARIVSDAGFRREVELTGELRAGLYELEARGDPAVRGPDPRPFWERPAYALAASVAAGLLALTALVLHQQLDGARATVAGLSRDLDSIRPAATARSEVLRLARVRSAADEPDLVWSRSGTPRMVELRLDAGLAPAASYEVAILRLEKSGKIPLVAVPSSGVSADGEVALQLNSAMLPPGDYRVRVAPQGSDAGDGTVTFRLRVTD